MASQYSRSVPFELPMAWEYSHRMRGRSWGPAAAQATMRSIAGYIGHTRSVAGRPPSQSRMIAPS